MAPTLSKPPVRISLYFTLWVCLCNAAPVPGQALGKLKDMMTKPKSPTYTSFKTELYVDSESEGAPRTTASFPPASVAKTDIKPSVKLPSDKKLAPLRNIGDTLGRVGGSVRNSFRRVKASAMRLRKLPNGKQYRASDREALFDDDDSLADVRKLPNGKMYGDVDLHPVPGKTTPSYDWSDKHNVLADTHDEDVLFDISDSLGGDKLKVA
ncbi:hypothetical protein QQS21_005442 [Conoideocrella luteorostrata]|uniref:Uncharacterized protein n=1 Tax=Conoideocrella luteorostrata TaxID=1105319 RepID=A0AAJ0CPM3_9HYPO|nr:hypothetical protein QQS21_005442 [Conoideocrella luteorostrata]